MTVLMADATQPWLIPHRIRHALAYANGDFAWTADQINGFDGHALIAVHAGQPAQARFARELDVERFDARPEDAGPFVDQRLHLGHTDGTVYCNRSTMSAVAASLDHARYPLHLFRWHVATLDGTRWVDVPFGILWAVQFETVNNAYDLSIVYGPLDFTTTHV